MIKKGMISRITCLALLAAMSAPMLTACGDDDAASNFASKMADATGQNADDKEDGGKGKKSKDKSDAASKMAEKAAAAYNE